VDVRERHEQLSFRSDQRAPLTAIGSFDLSPAVAEQGAASRDVLGIDRLAREETLAARSAAHARAGRARPRHEQNGDTAEIHARQRRAPACAQADPACRFERGQ
jgi:hypothetical protein